MKPFTFHITLYDAAFFAALFVALTFALQLWFTKNINRTANRFLSLVLVIMILWMVQLLMIDTRLETYLPGWDRLPLQFLLALGPLVYFYVLKITRPEYKFHRKDLLHFSPVLLQQPILVLTIKDSIRNGVATDHTPIFQQVNPIVQLLTFLSVSIYLYLSYRLIEQFYRQLKFIGGDRPRFAFRWLHRLLKRFGWLWLLSLLYIATAYFYYHQLSLQAYYPCYLFLTGMVIWMAAEAHARTGVYITNAAFKPSIPAELKQKAMALQKAIQAGRYYEEPELNISSLAEALGMPPHELSRVINIGLKKNFSDFINEFRIREMVRKMRDPAFDRMTLLGIAYECGFNSKTTFNRTFRQMTGKTPAEYKKSLKKERPFSDLEPYPADRPVVLRRGAALSWSPVKINRMTMFQNYFKLAWRNTLRGISSSSVNMLGLAAGLCSFIVILLYMNYELSYDKWSPELGRVYHVALRQNGDILQNTPGPLAGFLAQNYQNAEAATMLQSSGDREHLLAAGERKIYQKNLVTVDSNFLKVFPYRLAAGNPATALNEPRTAILSSELVRKLFGSEDPMGKTVKMNDRADLTVTGVLEDQPGATHLPVSMLVHDPWGRIDPTWNNYSCQTYIKLLRGEKDAAIETAINRLYYKDHVQAGAVSFEDYTKAGAKTNLFVDQVSRWHNFPKYGSSNFETIAVLLILAVLLVLAGAINFSNMAIARSIGRAKEIGIRKVMGSGRKELILQFMSETALQCLVSLLLAVVLLAFALPYINRSFNIRLELLPRHEMWKVALQLTGCLLAIILLSGLYPSFYLSRFNAIKVLKGNYSTGKKGTLVRNSLIVVQFMVSVFFITGIIVIKSQLHFMQTRDKGFSTDQLVRIDTRQETREKGFENTRNLLLSVPGVVDVAKTTSVPGDNFGVDTSTVPFNKEGREFRLRSVKVSTGYFKTLGVVLKKGRFFNDEVQDQQTRSAIINESAVRKLELTDPVGQLISFSGCDSTPLRIVGVVGDFNVQGFENAVQPVVFTIGNFSTCLMQFGGTMLVKLDSRHAQGAIAGMTQAWKKVEPSFPLRYSFVDQNFEALLISYTRLEKVITFFGIVAIMISMMGLFALTAFFTRQRTKEVGVRKVLGASVLQLAALLNRDFIYMVVLSVLIVTPFSWWMVQKWLQTFAYRIDISWWIFAAAGITAILIAIVTVSFQSIKAALVNPANSLRSE